MLRQPDAPAATAMQSSAVNAVSGCRCPGAATMPASPVNTTSDITHGFNNTKKTPTVVTRGSGRVCDSDMETDYLTCGSSLNSWNWGGEGSVHSSVVAPSPQGLFGALRLAMKASVSMIRKMTTPPPAMKAPMEE